MNPKKIIVRCNNMTITDNASTVAFTTDMKPKHKEPHQALTTRPNIFAIQFDNPKEAKEFDIDNLYEITISDKKK